MKKIIIIPQFQDVKVRERSKLQINNRQLGEDLEIERLYDRGNTKNRILEMKENQMQEFLFP